MRTGKDRCGIIVRAAGDGGSAQRGADGAVTAPARVSAQHQKLLHFVANATWSDEQMLAKVRELMMPSMTRHGPIEAWIIDDTSFPKKGRHSVGCIISIAGSSASRRIARWW